MQKHSPFEKLIKIFFRYVHRDVQKKTEIGMGELEIPSPGRGTAEGETEEGTAATAAPTPKKKTMFINKCQFP